ncbi:CHAT domain-containing protein [Amycolatopsis sp. NPDC051371]|uniref:CHAT domain-containing protein n=1 Tax=Amycolatopsis sp. NPDC051371 TaxID=3155800 RepID=UPI0034461EA9
MILPRIVVDVVPAAPAGWLIEVRGAGLEAVYEMPAQKIEVDGEAQRVPTGVDDAAGLLGRIRSRTPACGDIKDYGKWLFTALLGPVWPQLRELPEIRAAGGVELGLRWDVDQADLHRLVWEAMHHDTAPLAGDTELLIAITRLVPAEVDNVVTVERTPRVLFAMGGSAVDETIRPGAMFMGLLRAFDAEGVCSSKAVQLKGLDGLADTCAVFNPDLVHIVAHGAYVAGEGSIQLGRDRHVTAEMLAPALTGAHRPLAVVLSACGTGSFATSDGGPLAAQLVQGGIPIVSAVSGEVSEQACRLYTRRLVGAIGDGTPLATAAAQGRRAALRMSSNSADQLDWAMPSLYIADSVPATFRPIDPERAGGVVDLATRLKLRESPLFIGRTAILDKVDRLVTDRDADRIGVLGAVGSDISGLGGTRLLRELGYLLLLRGHLPLLLGPYPRTDPPKTLKDLLGQILSNIGFLTSAAEMVVPRLKTLEGHYDTDPPPDTRYEAELAFREACARFVKDADEPDWGVVQTKLTADFAALADAARTLGDPFGPHSRLVLLADDIHRWGVTSELLQHLEMYGQRGLGGASVAFTSSVGTPEGLSVKAFHERMVSTRGFSFPPLGPLTADEAVVGFQWVLLHPAQLYSEPEQLRPVYAARPDAPRALLSTAFQLLKGKPTAVRDENFYGVAELLAQTKMFVAADDEAAWTSYLELYP